MYTAFVATQDLKALAHVVLCLCECVCVCTSVGALVPHPCLVYRAIHTLLSFSVTFATSSHGMTSGPVVWPHSQAPVAVQHATCTPTSNLHSEKYFLKFPLP